MADSMITIYCNGSKESFYLVQQLESRDMIYEAKGVKEAFEDSIYDLPCIVIGDKVLNYKKALKYFKKRGDKKWQ